MGFIRNSSHPDPFIRRGTDVRAKPLYLAIPQARGFQYAQGRPSAGHRVAVYCWMFEIMSRVGSCELASWNEKMISITAVLDITHPPTPISRSGWDVHWPVEGVRSKGNGVCVRSKGWERGMACVPWGTWDMGTERGRVRDGTA